MGFGHGRLKHAEVSRSHVLPAKALREQIVRPGDVRNEIGFQNDINILLAALDDGDLVWSSEAPLLSPDCQMEDGAPPTLTELNCVADTITTSEIWAVTDVPPTLRAV